MFLYTFVTLALVIGLLAGGGFLDRWVQEFRGEAVRLAALTGSFEGVVPLEADGQALLDLVEDEEDLGCFLEEETEILEEEQGADPPLTREGLEDGRWEAVDIHGYRTLPRPRPSQCSYWDHNMAEEVFIETPPVRALTRKAA